MPIFIPSSKLCWSPKLKSTDAFPITTPAHAPTLSNSLAFTIFVLIIILTINKKNYFTNIFIKDLLI